mgnify:CR=1 FL=1
MSSGVAKLFTAAVNLRFIACLLPTGTVSFCEDESAAVLDAVRWMSGAYELPYLKTICDNKENDEEFLNPSIGTYLCDLNGQEMKSLFLNQPACADVKFMFKGVVRL